MSECERCGAPVTGLDRYCDDCVDADGDSAHLNDSSQSTSRQAGATRNTGAVKRSSATRLLGVAFLGIATLALGWRTLEYAGRYLQHSPMRYGLMTESGRTMLSVPVTIGLTVFYAYLSITLYRDHSLPARFAQILFVVAGLSLTTNLLVDFLPHAVSRWIPIVRGPGYAALERLYQLAIPQPPVVDWLVDYTLMAFAGAAITTAVALRFRAHRSGD